MTEVEEPEYQLESNLGEVRNGGNSTSMPALSGSNSKEGTESPQDLSCPNSQDNDTFCASYDDRNTLPLDNESHKRPKNRNSTKGLRSVSPPNLPPPPPPPPPAESEQENEEQFLQVRLLSNDSPPHTELLSDENIDTVDLMFETEI